MTRGRVIYVASLLVLLIVPSGAFAQPRPDTTIILGDRPTVIAFLLLRTSALSWYSNAEAWMRERFHEEVEGARPRLAERGVDLHAVYSVDEIDLSVVDGDLDLHIARSSTVKLRWQDTEWALPISFHGAGGHYLWSPGGPAYVCRQNSEARMVNHGRLYLHLLRTGIERDLFHLCVRAPHSEED